MPYYIYRVTPVGPVKQLEPISEFAIFREASAEAKRLRVGEADPMHIKVIFAPNRLQAEEWLSEVREPEPMIGDDY